MRDDHIALKFQELQSMFRLPGFIRAETLMDFWGCNRSLVSRRLKIIDHRKLALVRSEHMGGGKRWYWIDPYLPDSMDSTSISPPKHPRISVTLSLPVLDRCRAYCRHEGVAMSVWVARLIEQEIEALSSQAVTQTNFNQEKPMATIDALRNNPPKWLDADRVEDLPDVSTDGRELWEMIATCTPGACISAHYSSLTLRVISDWLEHRINEANASQVYYEPWQFVQDLRNAAYRADAAILSDEYMPSPSGLEQDV